MKLNHDLKIGQKVRVTTMGGTTFSLFINGVNHSCGLILCDDGNRYDFNGLKWNKKGGYWNYSVRRVNKANGWEYE